VSKPQLGRFVRPVIKRAINPFTLATAARLQWQRQPSKNRLDDAQLELYSKVLPGEFLHYGYFDDVDRQPGDISLNEIVEAQKRYTELLVNLANPDKSRPVLDVGCGVGGMIRLLHDRGFSPVALSPARGQVAHVESKFPGTPTVCSKFEDLEIEAHRQKYATVFTSESLQYLRLPRALPVMREILMPGGTWAACDFFNRTPGHPSRRLPAWPDFCQLMKEQGWTITYQQDITSNIIPTLRYIYMWATRLGPPVIQYMQLKLQRKHPGLHHLLAGVGPVIDQTVDENLQNICPTHFRENKQYMLFTLQRA